MLRQGYRRVLSYWLFQMSSSLEDRLHQGCSQVGLDYLEWMFSAAVHYPGSADWSPLQVNQAVVFA
jgi:hypothetical protein